MAHSLTLLPQEQTIEAFHGETLLCALQRAGLAPDAPCGGMGTCGKCTVWIAGQQVRACQVTVDRDMTVTLPQQASPAILTTGIPPQEQPHTSREGLLLALDIGTTTVAGFLLDGKTGKELAKGSALNPQTAFGADVISRIRCALNGQQDALTAAIRDCVSTMTRQLCQQAGAHPGELRTVSLVGNPAMQQLFLGISPENLARIPFLPVLTESKTVNARDYLPLWENASLLIVPDISGYVGADTLACVLATGLHKTEELTLLVDIGTNGEMVLGNRHRMVACSTAAGPALEGASIQFGMRAQEGAIDHVRLQNGKPECTVIGGETATGICGSGLIDAVATALEAGLLNQRGNILTPDKTIPLTDSVYLTQEDIRQVQTAKGAICAGILLMAQHLGVSLTDIRQVLLAGAFGTYLNPASACRIGLLPPPLLEKVTAVGNAAGSGAKLLACDTQALAAAQVLTEKIEFLELGAEPDFRRCFAQCMRFSL